MTKILIQYETTTNLNDAITIKLLHLAKATLSMSTYLTSNRSSFCYNSIRTIANFTKQSSSTFTKHLIG